MFKIFTISIFLLITIAGWAVNSGNNFKFYHLNTSNDLSQNTIHAILQDNDGYMWFGTEGGLNRWNGYSFTTFSYNSTNPNSIGQGRINCLYLDNEGKIWIGTFQGGISCYDKSTNSFENFFNPIDSVHDQRNNVFEILRFNNLIIYGTFGNGLFTLDPKTKNIHPVKIYNENHKPVEGLIIQSLILGKDSCLWIGHSKGAIKIPYKNIKNNCTQMQGQEYLKGINVLRIYQSSFNKILIGTQFFGTFSYDLSTQDFKPFNPSADYGAVNKSVVHDFIEDNHGNLWIATDGNGIFVLNLETNALEHYKSELNNIFTLSSDNIYRLFLDKNQNIWIGTYNTGINYINYHKQSFNHIRGFGKPYELNNNAILCFNELDDGKIMIGTDGGGLNIFDPQNRTFEKINLPDENTSPIKSVIVCMARDQHNNLYLGTYLKGLFVYNLKTKTFKNYQSGQGPHDLRNNNIWTITIANNGQVWLGTLGSGISRFEPETGMFYNYFAQTHIPTALSDDYISTICFDTQENLWVGTHNDGINLMEKNKVGRFKLYQSNNSCGLSSNDIWSIYEDSKNQIWVGTHDGGLCLFNSKNNTFKIFTTADGLPSNTIKSIVEDKHGNLWLGTNYGLTKFNYNGDSAICLNYTQYDGLQSNEFNFNSALAASNGYLYFGGNNGFNYFHPDSLKNYFTSAPTVIDDVKILYRESNTGQTNSIMAEILKNNNHISLNYTTTLITFEYALLDYAVPELNTYQYKLEGFDENWINAKTNRKATYTNLDPGNYIFKVKGINRMGIISSNEACLYITIQPPYWKKSWFRLSFGILILGLIASFFYLRDRAYRINEIQLRNMVDERTVELLKLNKVLADRNTEINQQSEELKAKSENLIEVNSNLEKSHECIEKQNVELEQHRNHLEELVKHRTEQLENAKLKAEESERLKMAFLANMSHEIRTPMNAIMGFSSLLSEKGFSDNEKENFSKIINTNSETLMVLIDDILDLSKIEANQLKISMVPFDFIVLINEIKTNWELIKQERNPEIDFITETNLPYKELIVASDQQRIIQIINNLIDNAFKFTSKGNVTLKAFINENTLTIQVLDTGIGIDKKDLSNIFDRFRKSDDTSGKTFRGAGLGLTISKKLAELLGGSLGVESEQGKGSVFTFKLSV